MTLKMASYHRRRVMVKPRAAAMAVISLRSASIFSFHNWAFAPSDNRRCQIDEDESHCYQLPQLLLIPDDSDHTAMALHLSNACFSAFSRSNVPTVRAVASDQSSVSVRTAEEAKVKLGGSELEVTKLGIGAWSWGDTSYWNNFDWDDRKLKAAKTAFDTSIDCGITFFDTAEVYGSRERKQKDPFAEVAIATKYAALPWRLGRQSVISALKNSLSRLELSCVDLYQLHWPGIWGNEGYIDGLADAVDQGLVKAVGVSNYSATTSYKSDKGARRELW
ncbi:uncharacterized oxidoreductase at1g06690 chloroplastic [Phtheirospermum japonicum]|uniref:Uncharacterized oxidoreductase at1g06690 chloroplastic n=1 Tax=Phtheirospermum japonicum TaxID=374723 RepID=A0A830CKP9_9LAMI|nr:uncharacterized oxidoreductase at1g06690 chloroplastic [Phtheirospermum japonicum]